MPADESADGPGKQHHESDRYNNGADHDSNVPDHSDRRDHRVEREHRVEKNDLNNHADETRRYALRGMTFLAFKTLMYFVCRFRQQEQPAADENQIASGDFLMKDPEQRRGQPDHPR